MITDSKTCPILFPTCAEADDRGPGSAAYRFGRRGEFCIRPAASTNDRYRAWALAYEVYRQKRYAQPDKQKLWYSLFDALPETVTVLIERDAELIASVTVVPDSPLGLPADAIFPDETRSLRTPRVRLAEAVSMVQREFSSRSDVALAAKLCEFTCLTAKRVLGATDLVITVNPRHQNYYQRLMLFEQRGGLADYNKVSGAPAVFLTLNFEAMNRHIREAKQVVGGRTIYRRFMNPPQAQAVAARLSAQVTPLDEDALHRYFMDERPILKEVDSEARRYILDRYNARHSPEPPDSHWPFPCVRDLVYLNGQR